jgi:alpha-1,2-mannosyltransferase
VPTTADRKLVQRHDNGVPSSTELPWMIGSYLSSHWLRRGATLAAIAVLVGLFVRTLQTSPFVDFEAYYSGAVAVRSGEPLYARALAYRDAGYTLDNPNVSAPVSGMPYAYPPAFAIAFLPLSFLPIGSASIIWFAIVFMSLVGAAYLLAGLLFPVRRSYRLPTALIVGAWLAVFQPSRGNLMCGQVEPLLFLLVVLSLAAFVRGQDYRAGIWLALAAAVKPTLGFLVLYFLWKRAYRSAATAFAFSALLFFGPVLLLGPGVLTDFVAVASHWSSAAWAVGPINQAPNGLLLRLFTENPYTSPLVEAPVVATVLRWTLVGLTLLMLVVSVSRSRLHATRHLALEFGLVVGAMLLVAPLAQDIYFIHLAIPLLAIAAAVVGGRSQHIGPIAFGTAAVALYVYLSLPSLRLVSHAFYLFYQAPVAGSLLLLTGAHTYGLAALVTLTFMTLHWHRHAAGAVFDPR